MYLSHFDHLSTSLEDLFVGAAVLLLDPSNRPPTRPPEHTRPHVFAKEHARPDNHVHARIDARDHMHGTREPVGVSAAFVLTCLHYRARHARIFMHTCVQPHLNSVNYRAVALLEQLDTLRTPPPASGARVVAGLRNTRTQRLSEQRTFLVEVRCFSDEWGCFMRACASTASYVRRMHRGCPPALAAHKDLGSLNYVGKIRLFELLRPAEAVMWETGQRKSFNYPCPVEGGRKLLALLTAAARQSARGAGMRAVRRPKCSPGVLEAPQDRQTTCPSRRPCTAGARSAGRNR
jgi:hypothetical protein